MAGSATPTLAEVLNRARAQWAAELRVSMPVTVLSYDAGKQLVSVQPQIADLFVDDEGVLQFETLKPINNVPVHFPAGGGHRLTFPIQPGDTGMIVVCDRSIDAWQTYGGAQQPKDARAHHLSDAWFECGVNPNGKWSDADAAVTTIGQGGAAADFAATAQRVLTQLQGMADVFANHTHILTVAGTCAAAPGPIVATGTAAPPATPMNPSAPASASLKVLG